MSQPPRGWSDERVEQVVGNLLRFGVLLAALVILAGGIRYLLEDGDKPADHRVFQEEPLNLRSPVLITEDALAGDSRALIQLGMLLLIATPVARVVFSAYAFVRQHDWLFVLVTAIVLVVLLYSLFNTHLDI